MLAILTGDFQFPEDGFDHFAGHYMTKIGCFKPIHCTKALWLVAIAETICYLITQLGYLFWATRSLTGTITSQLELVTAICLFAGLQFKNYRPIVVAVIIWMIAMFSFLVLTLLFIYCMINTKSYVAVHLFRSQVPAGWSGLFLIDHNTLRIGFGIMAFLYTIPMFLSIWFCNIGGRCYQYLRDYEDYRKVHGTKNVELGGNRLVH